MLDRVPPQNIDAEQSVLGAMLLEREAIFKVMEFLKPDDFYKESHRIIYEAILELAESGSPVDLITVTDLLRDKGDLEKVGGITYVATLANLVPTAANAEYYARIVEEKALTRALISVSTRIASRGYEGVESPEELLDEAERSILELSQRRSTTTFTPIKDILVDTFENLEQVYNNRGKINGVPTGFIELDHMTNGFQKGDLIILAARPSMGKTALAILIGQYAALKHKIPVAIFSLEMSKEQLVQRMLCSEAMVDAHKVRTGNLSDEDWSKLSEAARHLSRAPIYLDDTGAATVREMRSKARRLKAEKGLGLIIIDYLQLMSGGKRIENRQQEIADISRKLKGLAKELGVPVLALSQLSRAVESRTDKRPMMSDLRESGSIEQDADLIMFIYRDEYYNPDSEKKGIAEIIIAKQRNGPVGTVELGFFREFTKFVNLAKRE
ncbi:replicative DNA helicase [Desulfotomaculum nigrificans CO-1-SRB]|uniref:Replicative DNA helicase n=1 Tax=Desulfotomaculum nigrificans (strain DSM 14880 / VKM B-2319 / CO-1-SRB) TaxID=868595 RepID=F6B6B3_DESCC|nr:replicative DNA helicase [Desulfotomaculum nigrificans]AEF95536.1 replicative DNA helicase [Desulfotomaculum nigrificans CO-1-SRB]